MKTFHEPLKRALALFWVCAALFVGAAILAIALAIASFCPHCGAIL